MSTRKPLSGLLPHFVGLAVLAALLAAGLMEGMANAFHDDHWNWGLAVIATFPSIFVGGFLVHDRVNNTWG